MPTKSTQLILPRHPRWEEFIDRLSGAEGCDFQTSWTCYGGKDKRFSRRILTRMGLTEEAVRICLAYFEDHGGYCDCEVVLNLGERE